MDSELLRRVDALRRPLELGAANGFTGFRTVANFGAMLRAASDHVLARIAPTDPATAGLAHWRTTLARWEELVEDQQAAEIGKGMRLIARFPRPSRPAEPVSRTNAPGLRPSSLASRAGSAGRVTLPPLPAPVPPLPAPVAAKVPASSAKAAPRDDAPAPKTAKRPRAAAVAPTVTRADATAPTTATQSRATPAPSTIVLAADEVAARAELAAAIEAVLMGTVTAVALKPTKWSPPAPPHTATTAPPAAASVEPPPKGAKTTGVDAAPVEPVALSKARAAGAAPPGELVAPSRATAKAKRAADEAPPGELVAPSKAKAKRSADEAPPGELVAPSKAKAKRAADEAPPVEPVAPSKTKAKRAAAEPPPEPIDPLAAPTHSLPGIGPAFADRLAEKGLVTVEDLLWMVPRRYDDVRGAKTLDQVAELPEGERATFVAKVTSARMIFARGRRWAEVKLVSLEPAQTTAFGIAPPASAVVRWFNVFAGIEQRMPAGARVALSGLVRKRGGRLELANPDILGIEIDVAPLPADSPAADGGSPAAAPPLKPAKAMPTIIARYPDIAGVPAARMRAACAAACARVADCADDGVPAAIEKAAALPSLAATLGALHAPSADIAPDELAAMNRGDSEWQRRLAFGELFALGVAITLRRRERCGDAAMPCTKAKRLDEDLAAALPFRLTGAQRRSVDEIAGDLARDVPMNRLLQGDVGAGKTAVAFAAALQVARAGRQTAVMAPTELLAEQHMETWRAWAVATKLRIEVLTASTPKGIRQSLIALLGAGQIDVLIGTHALLAEAVGFRALGLVVIDEQHRFGVAQRARLRDKGDGQGSPHLLVMTATPIPRTLALTAFGDLDVSVLDELPPGRLPVATKTLSGSRGRASAYKLIAERVAAGERAYVVCPKVEPTEGDDDERTWKDATTTADELATELPNVAVGLVHGRLDSLARDRVMRAFKCGEIQVLVATTVIEVGVDVPAATVMVIHDAERFGLAQLHQLRGRVGRGGGAAHCMLLAQGMLGPDAEGRLRVMTETNDGFKVAEYDLSLRGPGELLGPKQAGVPRLRFGELAQHTALLLEARRFAEQLLDEDPGLVRPEHAALRRAIDRRFAQHVYGAESG